MRRIRYVVAASLDGYIAGPHGEADWIVMDPAIDFAALFAQFDTFVLGRRTFEPMARAGRGGGMPGARTLVVSRTLRPEDHPTVTILGEGWQDALAALRREEGKDVWLFGGGTLFRSMVALGLVDAVEVAVMPVMLGGGVPLLPPPAERVRLRLARHATYASGVVSLEYAVEPGAPDTSRRRRRRGGASAPPG